MKATRITELLDALTALRATTFLVRAELDYLEGYETASWANLFEWQYQWDFCEQKQRLRVLVQLLEEA